MTITDPNAPVTYKTIYYQQNADGETYTAFEQVTNSGVAGTAVTAPQKAYTHYVENTEKGTPSGNIQQDGSLVLSRYYDRASYSISFEVNGGNAMAPVSAVFGAAVSAPMQPTRMGYTFDGWYADETLKTPYTFSVMPTENITVYAKWALIGEGRGIEYEIIGITLRDSNYQPISEIPSGQFYAEVSVTNLASTTVDTITLAAYNANGQFLSMQYLYANPAIGQTLTFGVSVDNSSGQVAKIKAFVLPALGSLVPLANSAEK